MGLAFIKDFRKVMTKQESIITDFSPPRYWYSVGNLAVNSLISGSFKKGIPQGRITCLAGPSGCLPPDEKVSVYKFRTESSLGAPKLEKEE